MNLFALFTFIVQHYLQAHVSKVVIFNCWDLKSQAIFLRNASDHLLRTKMVDINKDFEFPGQNLNGIYTTLGIFIDFGCNKSSAIFNNASDLQLFISKYNWLTVDVTYSHTKFRQRFEDTMMSVDAQITYAGFDKTASNQSAATFILYDVYNNGKFLGGKLNITLDKKVTCDSEHCQTKYLSDLHLRTKYGNRCNLNDTTFRVSTVITRLPTNTSEKVILEFLSTINNPETDQYERFGYQCAVVLQDLMNYKVKYVFRDAWSTTGSTGGAIGDVALGHTELASSGFAFSMLRAKHVDYLLVTSDFRLIILFRTPRNEGFHGSVFLRPFTLPVWIAFGVILIGFAILLWVDFTIEFRMLKCIIFIPSLFLTCLISLGLACSQGAVLIPYTTGGRIAFLSLCVLTFIMCNFYTSSVVSFLVGSPLKSNMKTVGDLADSSLDIGIEWSLFIMTYIKNSKNSDVMKFVRNKLRGGVTLNSTYWLSAEDGMLKVRAGGCAFMSYASVLYPVAEKYYDTDEICDLNEIQFRPRDFLYNAMAKNSTYKEIVRINLMRILETGVISKHRNYWVKNKLHCFSANLFVNIGMEFTGPLFIFLGITYVFALVSLVFEIIYHKYS